ncbi:MAG: hypothetical protein WA364_13220, partial [Candidatus Nitrosopolaris sp.]
MISLDNDQLSVILIATITTSDIRSDSDGARIVCIISLPTARSNARISGILLKRISILCLMIYLMIGWLHLDHRLKVFVYSVSDGGQSHMK